MPPAQSLSLWFYLIQSTVIFVISSLILLIFWIFHSISLMACSNHRNHFGQQTSLLLLFEPSESIHNLLSIIFIFLSFSITLSFQTIRSQNDFRYLFHFFCRHNPASFAFFSFIRLPPGSLEIILQKYFIFAGIDYFYFGFTFSVCRWSRLDISVFGFAGGGVRFFIDQRILTEPIQYIGQEFKISQVAVLEGVAQAFGDCISFLFSFAQFWPGSAATPCRTYAGCDFSSSRFPLSSDLL